MKAIWLENNKIDLRELPIPLNPNEALIKVRLAGICATDLELIKGYYPFTGVPGHEFVGEVVALGEDIANQTQWLGNRVVGEINVRCGHCEPCRQLLVNHCENRTVLGIVNRNGVHAEYTTLPLENLHNVPGTISDEQAVFVEPIGAALEILEKVRIKPTDRVLVIGAGRLGHLIAQVLQLTGADLRVVAKHPAQIELLAKRSILPIFEEELVGKRWDVVVEATGSPAGFELARRVIRPEGKLVLKSTYKGNMEVNLSSIVVEELHLVGSRCGPFAPALRLMEAKKIDPTILIDSAFSMDKALEAYERAATRGVLKVLIKP